MVGAECSVVLFSSVDVFGRLLSGLLFSRYFFSFFVVVVFLSFFI